MKTAIGLIAPEWSLDRILALARTCDTDIKLVPFRFHSVKDIPEILDKNRTDIHKWLLSGPLPYHVARAHLDSDADLIHFRVTEAGLHKSLLEAAFHHGRFLEEISLDFMDEVVNVADILNRINIPAKNMHLSRYTVPLDEERVCRFHLDLWKKGATRCALTTIPYVYTALEQAGVPVYTVQVSAMEIGITLELLMERKKSLYFKNTQLGLLILETLNFETVAEQARTPYKLQALELEVNTILLAYCRQIGGYLIPKGNGRYEIFGSRGNIESRIRELNRAMVRISLILNTAMISGIGFGETVFLAQINSNKALTQARAGQGIVIFYGEGDIAEYGQGDMPLSYSMVSEDKDLNRRLQRAGVSIRTYRKMRTIAAQLGEKSWSAAAMAAQMGVTDRIIRRIVSGLAGAGLVAGAGEEASGTRGRRAKLYRFKPEST